jgi:hypothetical protein
VLTCAKWAKWVKWVKAAPGGQKKGHPKVADRDAGGEGRGIRVYRLKQA